MNNLFKKGVAITLALTLLFGLGIANADTPNSNRTRTWTTRYLEVSNDNGIPIYNIFNDETDEYEIVSIFNVVNISSHQYGASQTDFKDYFRWLIEDPLIWEEVQKYYPIDSFDDPSDAMFFYEKYFAVIADCGCGYAAAADYVFHLFEGREREFFEHFGYPMYTFNRGCIDFNYELFMLKFFNYSVSVGGKNDPVRKIVMKDLYEFQMKRLSKHSNYRGILPSNVHSWTTDDWAVYGQLERERERQYAEVRAKWENAKDEDISLGIALTSNFGNLHKYLKQYGITSSARYNQNTKKLATDDIIAGENLVLYALNGSGTVTHEQNTGLHYVYVVGFDNDGNLIVSSWGERYILDNYKSTRISQIRITVRIN